MKKQLTFTLLIAIALIMPACEDSNDSSDDLVSETDRTFMLEAADAGLFQVNAGQAAASNGSAANINAFGQSMIDRYTEWNGELAALAASKNIQLSTTLTDKRQEMLDTLAGLRNMEFDTTYINMMLQSHEANIDFFETASQNLADPQVKSWTGNKLSAIRLDLERARALRDSIQE